MPSITEITKSWRADFLKIRRKRKKPGRKKEVKEATRKTGKKKNALTNENILTKKGRFILHYTHIPQDHQH